MIGGSLSTRRIIPKKSTFRERLSWKIAVVISCKVNCVKIRKRRKVDSKDGLGM